LSVVYKILGEDPKKKEYGDLVDNNLVSWNFDDANPLVGLYGRQTESAITQLGFITLDTACQLAATKPVEPVEPTEPSEPTEPVVIPEEPVVLVEVDVEEEEKSSTVLGLPALTFILILVGSLVFIGLIVTSVCTLR